MAEFTSSSSSSFKTMDTKIKGFWRHPLSATSRHCWSNMQTSAAYSCLSFQVQQSLGSHCMMGSPPSVQMQLCHEGTEATPPEQGWWVISLYRNCPSSHKVPYGAKELELREWFTGPWSTSANLSKLVFYLCEQANLNLESEWIPLSYSSLSFFLFLPYFLIWPNKSTLQFGLMCPGLLFPWYDSEPIWWAKLRTSFLFGRLFRLHLGIFLRIKERTNK